MNQNELKLAAIATGKIYRECALKASHCLVSNWRVVAGAVGCLLVFYYTAPRVMQGFGRPGGFIVGLIADALLTLYYGWLSETARGTKLSWKAMWAFDFNIFVSIISVSFILYLVFLFSSPLEHQQGTNYILPLVRLFILFVFNAIPEAIYIHRYDGFAAFTSAATFTKANWIEWYLPFLLLLTPFFVMGNTLAMLVSFTAIGPLFPAAILVFGWAYILPTAVPPLAAMLVGILVASWYMFFRGFLFTELESGSRRRRIYMAKQR